jgi:hypothetical protein
VKLCGRLQRFGPGENSVRVVERPPVPPTINLRTFITLRRRADPIEGSVPNRIAVIAEELADLLSRESPLGGLFNRSHFASPNYVAGNDRRVTDGVIRFQLEK